MANVQRTLLYQKGFLRFYHEVLPGGVCSHKLVNKWSGNQISPPQEITQVLAGMLKQSGPDRLFAIRRLRNVGPKAKDCLPELYKILQESDDRNLRTEVSETIQTLESL